LAYQLVSGRLVFIRARARHGEFPIRSSGTPERWEAAFLLLSIAAIDLFGGYMFNIALSRRTMDVAGPAI
jgi:hypothetical protein